MEENENIKGEEMLHEEQEVKTEETAMSVVKDFSALAKRTNTKTDIFTNIKDNKKIFNLDSNIDYLLNDCENECIRVKEVLIKRFEKELEEPVINEQTGELIEKEIKMCCILIDDQDKSYVTGSKIFTIQMMRYIQNFGINEKGFEIKIIKVKMNDGKALKFELM